MEKTNFWKNYVRLCREHHISPSAGVEQMGYARSVVTRWSKGSTPQYATIQRVANHFGVDPSELIKECDDIPAGRERTDAPAQPAQPAPQPQPQPVQQSLFSAQYPFAVDNTISPRAIDMARLFDRLDPWMQTIVSDLITGYVARQR